MVKNDERWDGELLNHKNNLVQPKTDKCAMT